MKKKIISVLPFVFTLMILVLFYFKRYVVIRFYPPIMNFFFFMMFFVSLFREKTVIQKIALSLNPKLSQLELDYTKKLTYVWCVFLFLNFIISVLTIFMSDRIWLFYNGFLSYFLVGTIFIVEYVVRLIFRKRHNL